MKAKFLLPTAFVMLFLLIVGVVMYNNARWFPSENRALYTVKIYYQNGVEKTKTFDLPVGTKLQVTVHSKGILGLWYHYSKPFGNEYGYLGLGVNDFEIVKIDTIK